MKTMKRYSIQYSSEQRPINKFVAILLAPILVLAGIASAILFSAVFAALLLPVAVAGYFAWKRIKAREIIQNDDAIEADFKEIKRD